MAVIGMLVSPVNARAQQGWVRELHIDSDKAALPEIKQPQPGWKNLMDIQDTDGTAQAPSCGDPNVVATVRYGIIQALNRGFPRVANGDVMVHKINMDPVWVHPTFSGRDVCDTGIRIPEMSFITNADQWRFQTFARNGKALVFFYSETAQAKQ
jgi:hypothetical protein